MAEPDPRLDSITELASAEIFDSTKASAIETPVEASIAAIVAAPADSAALTET